MRTDRWPRLLTTLGLVAFVAVTGCAPSGVSTNDAPLVSGPTRAHYHDQELDFTHPAAWTPHKYEVVSSFSSAIVYLSNQPLHQPCTRSRVAAGTMISCGLPLDRLVPGGVLVEWSSNGFPGWTLDRAPGARQQLAGRPGRLAVERPGGCKDHGAEETITASIPRRSPAHNWYQLRACLRGPALDEHDRAVRQLLASTTLYN